MPKIRLVGDWVHVRRKFDEAIKALPEDFKGEIKVKAGLEMINELFRIERVDIEAGTLDSVCHAVRQEKSRPLTKKLKAWADALVPTIRPKSLSAVALRYMLERWAKLTLFLDHPILGLDTNDVENAAFSLYRRPTPLLIRSLLVSTLRFVALSQRMLSPNR
jgi:transposase